MADKVTLKIGTTELIPYTTIDQVGPAAGSSTNLQGALNSKLNVNNPECTGTFKLGATTLTEADLIKLKELIAAMEVTG